MKQTLAQELKRAAECIRGAKTVLIASHINPDGDTIGSLLALGQGLERLSKDVVMVSQDGIPDHYQNLPGANRVLTRYDQGRDLAIAVDCGAVELLGEAQKAFGLSRQVLQIDHHEVGNQFGDLLLIDSTLPAVGEGIYHLLKTLGVEIDDDIAKCLLTSIVVETASFQLPNVTDGTFRICAELLTKGINFPEFVQEIFWKKDATACRLFGLSLSRVVLDCRGKLAWSVVRQEDFRDMEGKESDVDDVADAIRTIEGVWVSVFFRELKDGQYRVSLRSKGPVNVAHIAEKFGGGGHWDAAGCKLPPRERAIEHLLAEVVAVLDGASSSNDKNP